MIQKVPWIERKFEFNFPIRVFPCILERLRGTPVRLFEMTSSLSHGILTARVDDSWSILEHIGHLFDLDELHEGRIDDFLSHAKALRPADMKNQKTNDANHNLNSLQNLLRQFSAARQRFVHRLEPLDETEMGLISLHPRLRQPMRLIDMTYFVAEHDDHHLARITELTRIVQKKN